MKIYTIGRDPSCQIVLNDNSDIVSRRHATLQVISSNKMTITDLSSNGTYVNGMRIAKNVPVPVTRKDTISFAHLITLDWKLVPKENNYLVYVIAGCSALLIILMILFGFLYYRNHQTTDDDIISTGGVEITNSNHGSSTTDVENDENDSDVFKVKNTDETNNKIKNINKIKNSNQKNTKKNEEPNNNENNSHSGSKKVEKDEIDENKAKNMIVG